MLTTSSIVLGVFGLSGAAAAMIVVVGRRSVIGKSTHRQETVALFVMSDLFDRLCRVTHRNVRLAKMVSGMIGQGGVSAQPLVEGDS